MFPFWIRDCPMTGVLIPQMVLLDLCLQRAVRDLDGLTQMEEIYEPFSCSVYGLHLSVQLNQLYQTMLSCLQSCITQEKTSCAQCRTWKSTNGSIWKEILGWGCRWGSWNHLEEEKKTANKHVLRWQVILGLQEKKKLQTNGCSDC